MSAVLLSSTKLALLALRRVKDWVRVNRVPGAFAIFTQPFRERLG